MRRRVLAALCAAVVLLSALIPLTAGAEEPVVCHLVINDHFFDKKGLNSNTMPISIGNIFYAPYTVFDKDVAGTDFKISCALRREGGEYTLTLFSMDGALVFDLNEGTASDGEGNEVGMHAVIHNGRPFIPIQRVCDYFRDLAGNITLVQYVFTDTKDYGYLIRLRNNEAGLGDSSFLSSAMSAMQIRYDQYMKSLTPSAQPSGNGGAVSTVPSPNPTPTPADGGKEDVRVYLAFQCGAGGGLDAILDKLASSGVSALFLFRPEDLSAQDGLVRRIVGEGHTLGLTVPGGSAEEAEAALAAGNATLERIAWTRTRIALPTGGEEEVVSALNAAGWRCWTGNVEGLSGTSSASGLSGRVMSAVEKRSVARITMDDTAVSAAALTKILSQLKEDNYQIRLALETELA